MEEKYKSIKVEVDDIKQYVYFIAEMSQNTGSKGMYGILSDKSDYMGGIFDRWINRIPESLIFNKYIFKQIKTDKKLRVITDFYKYKPKQETTGIAPDVLGIMVDDKAIPFSVFDEKWKPEPKTPQIEVKSFKSTQQMLTLRNQGYEGEYLVMVETNLRPDYLLPFFERDLFLDNVYQELITNDKVFIKSNTKNIVEHLNKVTLGSKELGTIKLLCVMKTNDFISNTTLCEPKISPIRVKEIKEKRSRKKENINLKLSDYCHKERSGLYRFDDDWYDGKEDGKTFIRKKSGAQYVKYLDFSCSDIRSIIVTQRLAGSIYIRPNKNVIFNNVDLKKDKDYQIVYFTLDRGSSKYPEYFIQKELIGCLKSRFNELIKEFERIANS